MKYSTLSPANYNENINAQAGITQGDGDAMNNLFGLATFLW